MSDVTPFLHQNLLGEAWDHATTPLAVFSDDGRYIACNNAFCELTGYKRDDVTKMRVGVDLTPDRAASLKVFQEIVSDVRRLGSGNLKKRDGSVVAVNFLAVRTRAAHLSSYIVVYWDGDEPDAARSPLDASDARR